MAVILVIDDSSFARKRIRDMVKAAGHETLEAADGRKGLAMTEAYTPDCILTDLLMPEMDGIEFLEELRQRGSKIPVIVLTADIQESTYKQCLALGAKAVLNKPPKKDALHNTIAEMLGLKEEAIP
jgi:CheY-like chemotaxis protein